MTKKLWHSGLFYRDTQRRLPTMFLAGNAVQILPLSATVFEVCTPGKTAPADMEKGNPKTFRD
jgi:hypothetical protein